MDLEVQLAHLEEREKSNTHRIDKLEEEVSEIKDLTIAVKEIATETKHMREEQTNMNKRLNVIEEKPAKSWDSAKLAIITSTISLIVGSVGGSIITLIGKGGI